MSYSNLNQRPTTGLYYNPNQEEVVKPIYGYVPPRERYGLSSRIDKAGTYHEEYLRNSQFPYQNPYDYHGLYRETVQEGCPSHGGTVHFENDNERAKQVSYFYQQVRKLQSDDKSGKNNKFNYNNAEIIQNNNYHTLDNNYDKLSSKIRQPAQTYNPYMSQNGSQYPDQQYRSPQTVSNLQRGSNIYGGYKLPGSEQGQSQLFFENGNNNEQKKHHSRGPRGRHQQGPYNDNFFLDSNAPGGQINSQGQLDYEKYGYNGGNILIEDDYNHQGETKEEHAKHAKRMVPHNFVCSTTGQHSSPEDKLDYEWHIALDKCQKFNQKFQDWEFPPNITSIGEASDRQIFWQEPQQIFKQDFDIFTQGILPNHLIPKKHGDKTLQCVIAALARYPKRILNIFISQKKNQWNCYALKMCWEGIMRTVIIDDKIPIDGEQKPFGIKTDQPELWAIFLEKAWAKLHGNYGQAQGNLDREILHDFTGAPTQQFNTKYEGTDDDLWLRIKNGAEQNYIMTARIQNVPREKVYSLDKCGLKQGYSYTILGISEAQINDQKEKLIVLQNPWVIDDNSKQYDSLLIWDRRNDSQSYGSSNKGEFTVSFKDFQKYFESATVCYYYDNFIYSNIELQCKTIRGYYFIIDITSPSGFVQNYYFFQISQKSLRLHDKDFQNHNEGRYYKDMCLILQRCDQTTPIIAVTGKKRDLTSQGYLDSPMQLAPGKYYCYIRVDWRNQMDKTVGLGCYGASEVTFQEINYRDCEDFDQNTVKQYDPAHYGVKCHEFPYEYAGKD